MVRPASMASTRPPEAASVSQRLQADRGDVETHVLPGLGHFHDGESARPAQRPGAADALVGPLDGLDGQHRLVADGHALPDVEPAHLLGQLPAEADVFPLPGRRPGGGELARADQQLGHVIGGGGEADAHGGELGDNRSQQAVVLAVFAPREEMGDEHADRPQVRHVVQPAPGLKQQHLVDLARHHRVGDAVPLEVAQGGAETGQAAPLEIIAHGGQLRVGVADDAQAIDLPPLPLEGLGDQQRIASPAGHQPDAARGGRALIPLSLWERVGVRGNWRRPVIEVADVCHNSPHPGPLPAGEGDYFHGIAPT